MPQKKLRQSKQRQNFFAQMRQRFVATSTDLSSRQKAMLASASPEERLFMLGDLIPQGLMVTELEQMVNEVFTDNFGITPLPQRLDDIDGEVHEMKNFNTIANLREEHGDSSASHIQLSNECGWSFSENVIATLTKIRSPRRQIAYSAQGRKKKIAILGGSFDPITNGHIQMAKFVLANSGAFDEVWLMPNFSHMENKSLQDSFHRLNMCELAVKADKRLKVFDYEIKHQLGGETFYFVQKLLTETFAKDEYDFSIIFGLDVANSFPTWLNYPYLERMIRFVVVGRQGYQPINGAWYMRNKHIFLPDDNNQIMDTSSTQVREMVASGNPYVSNLVDPKVLEYIKKNNLYLEGDKQDET